MTAARPSDRAADPDFVAYGAKGHRVGATSELQPILKKAFKDGGVHLVAVPIKYAENRRVLVDELQVRLV